MTSGGEPDLILVVRRIAELEVELSQLKKRPQLRPWFFGVSLVALVLILAETYRERVEHENTVAWRKQVHTELTNIQRSVNELLAQQSSRQRDL